MDSISRSPIYNNFSGALGGLDVLVPVRCAHWMQKHHAASDDTRFGYLVLTCSRWGSIRFEMVGHLMVIFVTIYISCVSALGMIRNDAGAGFSSSFAGATLMNTLLINCLLLKLTRSGLSSR